ALDDELHRLARPIAERRAQIVRIGDRDAVELDDQIADEQARTRGRTAILDTRDQRTALRRIGADAEVAASHTTVLLQLVDHAAKRDDGHRDVGTAQQRARVHADHRAVLVDQRAARKTTRDLAIRFDVAIELAAPRRAEFRA